MNIDFTPAVRKKLKKMVDVGTHDEVY